MKMKQEQLKMDKFIKSLALPQYIASVLFDTWEDCKLFFDKFYQTNRHGVDDLLDFREHKINASTWTSQSFLDSCESNGMKVTFEKVFLQSFTDQDIAQIEKAMLDKQLTLESLFSQFKANSNTNILKYVL